MFASRTLRDHMEECIETRRETTRQIDQTRKETREQIERLSDSTDRKFDAIRAESQGKHMENTARFEKIESKVDAVSRKVDGVTIRVLLIIVGALAAAWFEIHGLPIAHG